MDDGNFAVDNKQNPKIFVYALLVLVAVIGALYWASITDNKELNTKLQLLSDYQNGFIQCNSLCLEENKTGYVHAFDNLNHKCFCYSNKLQTMEVQDG